MTNFFSILLLLLVAGSEIAVAEVASEAEQGLRARGLRKLSPDDASPQDLVARRNVAEAPKAEGKPEAEETPEAEEGFGLPEASPAECEDCFKDVKPLWEAGFSVEVGHGASIATVNELMHNGELLIKKTTLDEVKFDPATPASIFLDKEENSDEIEEIWENGKCPGLFKNEGTAHGHPVIKVRVSTNDNYFDVTIGCGSTVEPITWKCDSGFCYMGCTPWKQIKISTSTSPNFSVCCMTSGYVEGANGVGFKNLCAAFGGEAPEAEKAPEAEETPEAEKESEAEKAPEADDYFKTMTDFENAGFRVSLDYHDDDERFTDGHGNQNVFFIEAILNDAIGNRHVLIERTTFKDEGFDLTAPASSLLDRGKWRDKIAEKGILPYSDQGIAIDSAVLTVSGNIWEGSNQRQPLFKIECKDDVATSSAWKCGDGFCYLGCSSERQIKVSTFSSDDVSVSCSVQGRTINYPIVDPFYAYDSRLEDYLCHAE